MNRSIVFYLLGIVMLPVFFGMLLSLGAGFYYGESLTDASMIGLMCGLFATCVLALVFRRLGRSGKDRIFRREALASVGLGWLLATLLGAIPLYVGIPGIGVSGAIFEASSGISTTGATVLSGLDELSRALLFWRGMMQWIGGLGVVVFFVALLSSLGAGAKILFSNESTGAASEFDQGRIQTVAAQIMWLYFGLSALCFAAYRIAGMDGFDAIAHMFTTVSTAGFSTRDASIGSFGSAAIEWVAIVFMTLGGITFVYTLRLLKGKKFSFARNNEVYYYLLFLLLGGGAIGIINAFQGGDSSLHEVFRAAYFQTVSLATTTGYGTQDYTLWLTPCQFILVILMFFGGCSGSTSGGAKTIRIIIAAKAIYRSVHHAFRPHCLRPIRINQKVLEDNTVAGVVTYLMLLVFITLGSFMIISLMEPAMDEIDLLGAVQGTFFNIGPGFGSVGPSETYAHLNPLTKCFLAFLMLLGRLELYAILVLMIPSFWRRYA
jgi:trk system potassium uptake protein TrkH